MSAVAVANAGLDGKGIGAVVEMQVRRGGTLAGIRQQSTMHANMHMHVVDKMKGSGSSASSASSANSTRSGNSGSGAGEGRDWREKVHGRRHGAGGEEEEDDDDDLTYHDLVRETSDGGRDRDRDRDKG